MPSQAPYEAHGHKSCVNNPFSSQHLQFLFLNTLRPAAGSATTTFFCCCAAEPAAFFAAVAPLRAADVVGTFLVVVAVTVVVILPPPLAAAAALFAVTTVVPVLEVLVALEVDMALAVRSCGGTGGGAIVLFFAAVVVDETVLGEIFRAAVRVLFFACSTIPARLAVMALVAADVAVFRGLAGFKGEGGRAR